MNLASRPLIYIVYAHEPEVKALKSMVKESGLDDRVTWRRWRSNSDRLFISGSPDPDLILNIGFAGRLNPELTLGEVVAVGEFLGERAVAGRGKPCGPTARFVTDRIDKVSLVTTKKPVLDEGDREALRNQTGADIVDMEAGFLYGPASAAGVPFAAIKLISDGADGDARAGINRRIDEWSNRLAEQVNGCLGDWLEI